MSKNVIWLINHYASTPDIGMGGRTYYIAKFLAKMGFKVYLISAGYNHKLRKEIDFKSNTQVEKDPDFDLYFVRIKVPKYKNSHSKMRIVNWFIFSLKLRLLVHKVCERPDAIICSSPSLLPVLPSVWFAKKFSAKFIFEVRDIWPLTLTQLGGYSSANPFIKFLQLIEDYAYKNANSVVSNLPNSVTHMKSRGLNSKDFYWIPNGFDKDEINSIKAPEYIVKALNKSEFVIGYTGAIGKANALEYFIESARKLEEYQDVLFVIIGDGQNKESLIKLSNKYKLKNVLFIDPIPKEQIQSVLSLFDVCYIGWKSSDLYQYGIAANKLTEYLVSGRPILHSYSGKCDLVKLYNAGISVPAENVEKISNAILEFRSMPTETLKVMSDSAKYHAYSKHEFSMLAKKYSELL